MPFQTAKSPIGAFIQGYKIIIPYGRGGFTPLGARAV